MKHNFLYPNISSNLSFSLPSNVCSCLILAGLLHSEAAFAAQPAPKEDELTAVCAQSLVRIRQPDFQELVTAGAPATDRLFDLMERGLSDRFRNEMDVSMLSYDMSLRDVRTTSATFEVQWPGLSVTITKSLENSKLLYRIVSIHLSNENGDDLPLHQRPKGLSVRFAKLMVAITEAVRADVFKNTQIRKVNVIATHVIHLGLIDTLRSIGFEFVPMTLAVSVQSRERDFYPNQNALTSAQAEVSELYPDQGRSMILRLQTISNSH